MDTKKIKGLTLALSTALVVGSNAPLNMVFGLLPIPPYAGLCLVRLIQIAAILAVVVRIEKSLQPLGLTGPLAHKGVLRGIVWSLCFGVAAAVGMVVLLYMGYNPLSLLKTRLPAQIPDRVFFFIAGGLIAPLAEELFFRGIVFGFLRRWGFAVALLTSTGIFVLIHSVSGFPLVQIVGGLVFTVCYEKEKSLWAPLIIHAAGNIALFTLSLL